MIRLVHMPVWTRSIVLYRSLPKRELSDGHLHVHWPIRRIVALSGVTTSWTLSIPLVSAPSNPWAESRGVIFSRCHHRTQIHLSLSRSGIGTEPSPE